MYHAPWGDAPGVVLDHIRALAETPAAALDTERQAKLASHEAEQQFLQLTPEPWRFFFSELLRLARVYTQLDDLEHYHTTRLNRPIRRAIATLGERLVKRGLVDEPLDLFFAKTAQIDALLIADTEEEQQAFAIAVRESKQAYLAAAAREPAWTPGGDEWLEEHAEGPLKGLPGSPGIAEGLIHHVRGPEDFAGFPVGAVLVSRTTNPAWTPLFHLAAAVITESGGPLSHGAVTARELGIPAVMSVPGCLSRLPQGSRVKVDGLRGLVMAG
ncbi:PEP-utilizing enzyme [Haloferula sp. BvORR071]|uniref:PEP-utilizing enzyme n=1 Tax=Haloferula sp. BvORR071 TaxID=1396141 RepID=UPI002240F1DB|nr:PEP-utilizing enzyme [Haloferula sp. BvORR071]